MHDDGSRGLEIRTLTAARLTAQVPLGQADQRRWVGVHDLKRLMGKVFSRVSGPPNVRHSVRGTPNRPHTAT
jgi:hypothetical protein